MLKGINKDIYFYEVKEAMPRILNLLNRNPSSKSYGSFDRDYWNYNSFDISNARKQEAVLTLALMHSIKREDNPYYNNNQILEWINIALDFTKKLQNKDGSFNEMYPYEHSFVATAFVCYAVSETLLLLKNKIKKRDLIIGYLKKSGEWLIKNDEKMALNQKAGSVIALYNIYLLTNNLKYKKGAKKKLDEILGRQSKEGWFVEYDGADIGYLSLSIDYLAKYYKKTKDKYLLSSLKKACNFIQYFALPNHTFGGEIGSRNTEYIVPHGFELLSNQILSAKVICGSIRKAIKGRTTISPATIDDRYLLFNGYTYLQAYNDGMEQKIIKNDLFSKKFTKYFSDAGILIKNGKYFYIIVNIKKGGVSKIIFKNNKSLSEGGSVIKLKDEKSLGSNYLGRNEKVKIEDKQVEIKRKFIELKNTTLTPFTFLLFRAFQLTFGRNHYVSRTIRNFLRNKIIKQKNKITNINFSRKFLFKDKELKIIDEIGPLKDIDDIIISSKLSFIFAESSRFFQISDLESDPFFLDKKLISKFLNKNRIVFYRKYSKEGNLSDYRIS